MSHPACLEENFVTDLKLSTKMASGESRPCCYLCQNFSFTNPVKDKLARDPGPARGLYSGSISLALSHNPISVLALVSALAATPAAINDLFK